MGTPLSPSDAGHAEQNNSLEFQSRRGSVPIAVYQRGDEQRKRSLTVSLAPFHPQSSIDTFLMETEFHIGNRRGSDSCVYDAEPRLSELPRMPASLRCNGALFFLGDASVLRLEDANPLAINARTAKSR